MSVLRKEPKILDSIFRRNYNNRLLKLAQQIIRGMIEKTIPEKEQQAGV